MNTVQCNSNPWNCGISVKTADRPICAKTCNRLSHETNCMLNCLRKQTPRHVNENVTNSTCICYCVHASCSCMQATHVLCSSFILSRIIPTQSEAMIMQSSSTYMQTTSALRTFAFLGVSVFFVLLYLQTALAHV